MIYVLFLNNMHDRCEAMTPVAWGTTAEGLVNLLKSEKVPSYTDDGTNLVIHDTDHIAEIAGGPVAEVKSNYKWHKNFRQGGPFEWYNPPISDDSVPLTVELLTQSQYGNRPAIQAIDADVINGVPMWPPIPARPIPELRELVAIVG